MTAWRAMVVDYAIVTGGGNRIGLLNEACDAIESALVREAAQATRIAELERERDAIDADHSKVSRSLREARARVSAGDAEVARQRLRAADLSIEVDVVRAEVARLTESAAAAERDAEACRGVMREVEWGGRNDSGEPRCPSCRRLKDERIDRYPTGSHANNCALSACLPRAVPGAER